MRALHRWGARSFLAVLSTPQNHKEIMPFFIVFFCSALLCLASCTGHQTTSKGDAQAADVEVTQSRKNYQEISWPTPNIKEGVTNSVEGVILHHTAEPTIERSLGVLTSREKGVGTHCVIDLDGTRYIMCDPEVVTYHAGLSLLNGKEGCNSFTIGIEFQGNTLEAPLTEDQIASAIEYLRPIITKYKIPITNIVTHEMVRTAYKEKHPERKCNGKVDITPTEYHRFITALESSMSL